MADQDDGIVIEERTVPETAPSNEQPNAKIEALNPYQEEGQDVTPSIGESAQTEESIAPVEEEKPSAVATEEELPKSAKKRIDKYMREKREAEEKAFQLQQLLQQQMQFQGGVQPSVQRDPYAPVEPHENDPKYVGNDKAYLRDYVKYQKDLIAYESQRNHATRQYNERTTRYQAQVEAAREKYEDFDEAFDAVRRSPVIANHPNINAVSEAIQELDNAADVAYYLFKHPSEFQAILDKTPMQGVIQLGLMSGKLAQAPVQAVKPSGAPPIKNINGSGSPPKVKKHFAELSIDEMEAYFRNNP